MKKESNNNEAESEVLIDSRFIERYEIKAKVKPQSSNKIQNSSDCDYGLMNQYKLDDLINLQADGFSQNKVVRLIFVQNRSLHLQEAGVQIFEKYLKNQIMFIGVYGKSQSGKSLLLDKVINLTQVEGSHFARHSRSTKGIYLWSIPFSRNNTKIFLLDIDGYKDDQIDSDYSMLLSFLLFLSSSFLVLSPTQDPPFQKLSDISVIYRHIKKSKKQFISKNQAQLEAIWPPNLYCLFRNYTFKHQKLDSLRGLFKNFNFTVIGNAMEQKYKNEFKDQDLKQASMRKFHPKKKMLNQSYIRSVSGLIRHIHNNIEIKALIGMRFTGINMTKLMINAVQGLNVKEHLNLDKIHRRSLKQLYSDAYHFHTQLYNKNLAKFLDNEKPLEVDSLIHAFRESNQLVFKSFNQLTISAELNKDYGSKLQNYISQKQRIILAINKKKSNNQVKSAIPPIKPQIVQINEFIKGAKNSPKYLQQVYVKQITPIIASTIKEVDVLKKTSAERQIKRQKQLIQSKIKQRQGQLRQLQSKKEKQSRTIKENLTKRQNFYNQDKQLNEALAKLKEQLAQIKLSQLERKQKQTEKIRLQQEILKKQEQKLKKDMKIQQKTISQLRSKVSDSPNEKIDFLSSQIQQKQKEIQSVIPRLQSIQGLKSTLNSPRKVESRVFKSQSPNIRVINSPKT